MSISGVLHVVVVVGLGAAGVCSAGAAAVHGQDASLLNRHLLLRSWGMPGEHEVVVCAACLHLGTRSPDLPVDQAGAQPVHLLKYMCPASNRLRKQPVTGVDDCTGMSSDGDVECVWTSAVLNFDNIWNAWTTLAVIMTGSGWSDALYAASDTIGIGLQPQQNYSVRWPPLPAAVVHVLIHSAALARQPDWNAADARYLPISAAECLGNCIFRCLAVYISVLSIELIHLYNPR